MTVDDNSKVALFHVVLPLGQSAPAFTHSWKIGISNRDKAKQEKNDAITLTSSGTTQVNIQLRGDSIWLPSTGANELKFHDDKACHGTGEDPHCDHLVHVTITDTGSGSSVKGLCETTTDSDGDPDGYCAIVIGTASSPFPCN
jgi:hypothetical protein